MEKLTESAIQTELTGLVHWQLDDKTIYRRYKCDSFPQALQFVNLVGEEAERRNHHPFISIDYKMVTLRLTSWHAGGLTQADFDEARACDELFASLAR